ncbi:MAG TPA: baseplate J/gp47 family protein [Anaerolineales bacterium]|nr:baseplate J/gp47 family protein [Anaerolineales bacterium]
MKTQLIQLEPNDDFISVSDRMGWSQTGRILLVWPRRSQVLTRRLDLVLLLRRSTELGAQLALVTNNSQVRYHAAELGVPVYKNASEAQSARWRTRRLRWRNKRSLPPPDPEELRANKPLFTPGWQSHTAVRLGAFAIGVLALLTLMAFLLPGAQLTLTPEVRTQEITLPVSASAKITAVNLAGELPARPVSIIVEGRGSLDSSGTIQVPYKPAIGSVRFTNLTEQIVTIPAGTIVSSLDVPPIRFKTNREGKIQAGPGKSTIISCTALLPGPDGNLAANSLVAIEGGLGLSLSATNPAPTHSGSSGPAPAPSTEDRLELYNELLDTLHQTALADLQTRLSPGDIALLPTLALLNTLEETYTPAEGEPGAQVELTLQLEFQVLVVSNEDLNALVTPIMNASLPAGFTARPDTLATQAQTSPKLDKTDGVVRWTLYATRTLQAEISPSQAVGLALGQPTAQANLRLAEALPLAEPPELSLYPSWWPRLPFLPFRISVLTYNQP